MRSYLEEVNFPLIQQRFDAFWQREVPDGRPLIAISAPTKDPRPPDFPVPERLQDRWLDIEYILNRAEHRFQNTVFLGDSIPSFFPNIGPDSFAAYLGGELRFLDEGTSWVVPFVDDLSGYEPVFDRENKWWRFMMELIEAACEVGKGRFLVGIPDMHGGGDALAAVRHPDKLALDLYDRPEHVRRIMLRLTDIYREMYDAYREKTACVQEGTTTWLPAYSRGKYCALQNDFSGLVSPEMFRRFFLDDIRQLAEYLDNAIYHLDGPMALGNLDYLLEIESLDGIQWVPGAAARPMSRWVDVCARVLDAGKCLQISCTPQEVEFLLSELDHRGLFITTHCDSEEQGRHLLKRAEALAR